MKLYVDDVRPVPVGWMLARTVEEAKLLLEQQPCDEISLDHDMGACEVCRGSGADIGDFSTPEQSFVFACSHALNGYDLLLWMIETHHVPPIVHLHSLNPVGRKRMRAALEVYARD